MDFGVWDRSRGLTLRKGSEMETFHFKVYIYTILIDFATHHHTSSIMVYNGGAVNTANPLCRSKMVGLVSLDLSKPIKVDLQDFKRGVGHCLLDLLRQTEV